MNTPVIYNVAAAAKRIGVSPNTIRRLVGKGLLPHLRVGPGRRLIRISEEQIVEYLQRQVTVGA